jgi:hypothetical protein
MQVIGDAGGGAVASELLRWNLDDASVIVEADEAEIDGWIPVAAFGSRAVHDAQVRLEDALANVGKAARAAVHALQEGASTVCPDEIEVQFGIKFGTEAGVVIAKTTLEGQLNVTMRWHAGTPELQNE